MDEAIEKLTNAYLSISQSIGFAKVFGSKNQDDIEFLEGLEKDLREAIELLGYDVALLMVKENNKKGE